MITLLLTARNAASAVLRAICQLLTRRAPFVGLVLLLALASAPAAQAQGVLQWWPLKLNDLDSTALRSSVVLATSPSLKRLVFSDGSVAAYPARSTRYGQAIAPTAAGLWTVAAGGPAGNPSRRHYEQFTLTVAAGSTVRVDSVLLWAALYNTTGKLAVGYSITGFTPSSPGTALDSADVTGGKGPGGALPATANGAFATPIALLNQNTGTNQVYRLALNNATGVSLTGGQTLTVRLYFACSSSSAGRYALLKDVVLKGQNTTSACNAAFSYSGTSFCQSGTSPSPTITGTAGGTFASTTGLSINTTTGAINLGSSTPGTYTVTYTLSATCSSTASVTISGSQSATFSYGGSSYCTSVATGQPVVLATGSTAGTFASTTGLTLNATTGAITPSTSTPGTYTVTNSVAAAGSCAATSATTTVTITAQPTANIGYGATGYCTTATGSVALGIGTGSTLGTVTVNPTTGLSIAANGAITPSTSTPGTYFVTNTVAAGGGCAAATGGTTVTITAPQTAGFSYGAPAAYCTTTTSSVAPTLATGASAGVFSSTTGLSLNATTGAITPSTSTPGTYTVTNTVAAAGGCAAATNTTSVTITAPQTAGFSYGSATYCVNGSNIPTAILATGATAGTFSSTMGLTLSATTGTITLASTTAGTYTITNTVAASGGCAAVTSTATVTVTAAPSAVFTYANTAYCASGTPATATVTGTAGGTFAVAPATGLVVNATTGALTLAGATAGTYTVTYSVGSTCAANSIRTVTINALPATPTLTTSGTPATGITLTSSAATGNQFYLNGVAITGATAQTYFINSGTRNGAYTVTTTNANGCTSATSAAVTVTVTATRSAGNGPELSVYPNPTPTGQVQVALTGNTKAVELTVLNALGQLVFRQQVAAGSQVLTLDLSALPTGVYVLQGRSADGTTVRRFVRE